MASDDNIHAGFAQSEVAQRRLGNERRQTRVDELDFARRWVKPQSERCFEQGEWRGAGPGLRRAGNRIKRRSPSASTLETAEQFRQATQVHIGSRVEEAFEYAFYRPLLSVPGKPKRDQGIVVGPD